MGIYRSTKTFSNYSVALRQWRAQHSHCQLLHGYALKFKVWFESNDQVTNSGLDEMNWVVDYGGFKSTDAEPTPGNGLKDWMNSMWDHTLLIEKDDPQLETFEVLQELGLAKLVVLDKMGAESCAKLVFEHFNERLALTNGAKTRVVKVECWESDLNSSTYQE